MQRIKTPTLRRNFSWTFTGNVVYTACQWGMLVMLAKLGTPEMLGQFTLGIAIATPVIMFTNLQLRAVQATDAKNEYNFSDYLGLRLLGTAIALLAIAGITIAARYNWETSLVILAISFAKAFESISDVFYGLIQQHECMNYIAVSLLIKGPLSLLLLSLGIYLTDSVLGGAVGLAIAWALVLFSYDIRKGAFILKTFATTSQQERIVAAPRQALQPCWHLNIIGKLVWLTLPLGCVMMLISLNTNIPRYFIEQDLGKRELGIFAAIAYLMIAGQIVVSALAESASPRLAKEYAAGNSKAFSRLLLKLIGIGCLLGGTGVLVAVVAGEPLLTLIYRPEYAQQADLLTWLMVAAGIGYISSFLGYGMTAARYFRIQIPLYGLTTCITATASYLLIPTNGLQGAAIALIFAAIVQVIFSLGTIFYAVLKLQRASQHNS